MRGAGCGVRKIIPTSADRMIVLVRLGAREYGALSKPLHLSITYTFPTLRRALPLPAVRVGSFATRYSLGPFVGRAPRVAGLATTPSAGIVVIGGILATRAIKMCPAGGTDPQDRGRTGRSSWCSCVCGMFFVWARAVHLRPLGTSASGGQGVVLFADRVLFLLAVTKCVCWGDILRLL